jgi:alanyl-tRNA synthetase
MAQAIEKMCRDSLAAKQVVYSKEVPLSEARAITGLRAVFGEVTSNAVQLLSVCMSV